MFVTDFAHHLKGEVPIAFAESRPAPSGRRNVIVCLAQWRDSAAGGAATTGYRSGHRTSDQAGGPPPRAGRLDALIDVMTFFDVEKAIVRGLRDRVTSTADDHQRRRGAGDRLPEARRALGEPDERRLVRGPPQGPPRRLRRPGGCRRLLHNPKFVLGRVRLRLGTPPSTKPTRRSFTGSTSFTASSARRLTRLRLRAGACSSRSVRRSRRSTRTGSCPSSRSPGVSSWVRSWRSGRSSGCRTSRSSSRGSSDPGWRRRIGVGSSSSSATGSATRRLRNSPENSTASTASRQT